MTRFSFRMQWRSAAAGLLLLAASFASQAAAEQPPAVIRIGVATAGIGGRPYCGLSFVCSARVQGVVEKAFAADGTRIEWSFYSGAGPAVNEALAGGQLDFAWEGDLAEIIGRSIGLKTKLLMSSGGRLDYYIAVPANSPVHTMADLRGKSLALFKGTNIQTVGVRILESEGLSVNDVHLLNLDPATALPALAAGQIDATLLSFWGFGLRDSGKIRFIYSTAQRSPKFTAEASLLVTDSFQQLHPAAVQRVVDSLLTAARWASDETNRQALYEIYAKSGYPARFFADAFDGHDMKVQNDPLFDAFNVQQYRDVAAIAWRLGLIRHQVTIDDWIDTAPLDHALAAQGLTHFWPRFAEDGKTELGG